MHVDHGTRGALHPVIWAAAEGRLPDWTEVGAARLAHMSRVADLLTTWADALSLSPEERARWRSLGYLHDLLRDADPEALRSRVPPAMQSLPARVLHGPAASERLRVEGVQDGAVLRAVAYHTLGHALLGAMGRALYCADFLEAGRDFEHEWRAEMRSRMPRELDLVTREIVAGRVRHLIAAGTSLLPETLGFWNVLVRREA